jgi:DNA (cytosine-5)-methyltransferase 1
VEADIRQVKVDEFLKEAGLKREEVFLVNGGPPCQPFSTAGKRLSIGDPRGSLFKDFVRFIEEVKPPYFLMENVRGILSASIKHRPLDRRGSKAAPLDPDEQPGSALKVILAEFKSIGYTVNFKLVNSAQYGVPQVRERVIFLGSRDGQRVTFPYPTHAKGGAGDLEPYVTMGQGLEGLVDPYPQYQRYSEARAKIFDMVPPGGNWRSLPKELQPEALGGAFTSTGGRVGFYRRLSLERPSPTIITAMTQKASGMCHPAETRPLSVVECKRLQQFPDDWQFCGSVAEQYRQIGNAVPVGLGKAIGMAIMDAYHGTHGTRVSQALGKGLIQLGFAELERV